jgi:hypothetical protein
VRDLQFMAKPGAHAIQQAKRFFGHLRANSIARDNRQVQKHNSSFAPKIRILQKTPPTPSSTG